MKSELIQSFDFAPSVVLRSLTIDGQPWFVAKDICDALGLSNPTKALASLDEDERNSLTIQEGNRGNPNRVVVSESGLYALIMKSRKPEAKAFRKWVTSVVLPSLRKDGVYFAGQERPIPEDMTIDQLMAQISAMQAAVDARKEAQLAAWVRSREEREARSTALRALKHASRVTRSRSSPRAR